MKLTLAATILAGAISLPLAASAADYTIMALPPPAAAGTRHRAPCRKP